MFSAIILGHNPKIFPSVQQHKKLSNNFVGKSNNRKNRKKSRLSIALRFSKVVKAVQFGDQSNCNNNNK